MEHHHSWGGGDELFLVKLASNKASQAAKNICEVVEKKVARINISVFADKFALCEFAFDFVVGFAESWQNSD